MIPKCWQSRQTYLQVNHKANQHSACSYIVISIILIKPSILLIKMCTGNQSVTRQWEKQSWRKWIEFKTWKPSFDRQLSAIHYRLPNDFFSTPLMKCCSTFLCMTGDFSHNDTCSSILLHATHLVSQLKTKPPACMGNFSDKTYCKQATKKLFFVNEYIAFENQI